MMGMAIVSRRPKGGVVTLYINRYYEKSGEVVTAHYYLGGKEIAQRQGTALSYIHQDSLSSTSVMSDESGDPVTAISYFSFENRKAINN